MSPRQESPIGINRDMTMHSGNAYSESPRSVRPHDASPCTDSDPLSSPSILVARRRSGSLFSSSSEIDGEDDDGDVHMVSVLSGVEGGLYRRGPSPEYVRGTSSPALASPIHLSHGSRHDRVGKTVAYESSEEDYCEKDLEDGCEADAENSSPEENEQRLHSKGKGKMSATRCSTAEVPTTGYKSKVSRRDMARPAKKRELVVYTDSSAAKKSELVVYTDSSEDDEQKEVSASLGAVPESPSPAPRHVEPGHGSSSARMPRSPLYDRRKKAHALRRSRQMCRTDTVLHCPASKSAKKRPAALNPRTRIRLDALNQPGSGSHGGLPPTVFDEDVTMASMSEADEPLGVFCSFLNDDEMMITSEVERQMLDACKQALIRGHPVGKRPGPPISHMPPPKRQRPNPPPQRLNLPLRVPRKVRFKALWKRRMARDARRCKADRDARSSRAEPLREAPPTLSPSFNPLLLLSPNTQIQIRPLVPIAEPAINEEDVEMEEIEMGEAQRDSHDNEEDGEEHRVMAQVESPFSEPPEYEQGSPEVPVTLNLAPRRQIRRPRSPAPPDEAPRYAWLNSSAGGEYTRRSPSPPPPFNAQTDCETLVPVRFDEDFVARGRANRRWSFGRVGGWWNDLTTAEPTCALPSRHTSPGPVVNRAFTNDTIPASARPGASYLAPAGQDEIITPRPVRHIDHAPSSWEAALDLEEGEVDDGDDEVEGALGGMVHPPSDGTVLDATVESVIGAVSRLFRSVMRW